MASISISNSRTPSLFATPKVFSVLEAGFGVYFHPNLTLTAVRTPELLPRARVSIRPRLHPRLPPVGFSAGRAGVFCVRQGYPSPHALGLFRIQHIQRQHRRLRLRPLSPQPFCSTSSPKSFPPPPPLPRWSGFSSSRQRVSRPTRELKNGTWQPGILLLLIFSLTGRLSPSSMNNSNDGKPSDRWPKGKPFQCQWRPDESQESSHAQELRSL
jgi:hypothetical protein